MSQHSAVTTEAGANFGFLIHDIARLLRKEFDRRAQSLGFTRAQWSVIAHLRWNEGINQAGLADRMEIEPITLVRLLDRLQEMGLIERRQDPADRRAHRLYLTAKAEPTLAQMSQIGQGLKAEVLSGFGPDEREQLVDLLRRLKSNLISVGLAEKPVRDASLGPAASFEQVQNA